MNESGLDCLEEVKTGIESPSRNALNCTEKLSKENITF